MRERGLVRPGLLDRWAMNSRVGALWARDLRLFFRDANQAAQLILVGVLVLLYTTSLQYLPLGDTRFQVVAGFLHLAFQGFVIGGVGVRLAYPLLSPRAPATGCCKPARSPNTPSCSPALGWPSFSCCRWAWPWATSRRG